MKTVHDLLKEALDHYCTDERISSEIDGFTAGFLTAFDMFFQPDTYILVPWPEIQDYMDQPWFEEEAVLNSNSSYLIPIERLTTLS